MQNNESMTSPQDAGAGFYRAFEDEFRGSRELILSRLQAYLPFIEPLKRLSPGAAAVDLGCGRGEWLQLLGEHGFDAQGVDLDAGMLQACKELGLRAVQGNAIDFLKQLPNESQAIVSGFHIAEHIPFEALQTLVEEALRVLQPAGLLILETPNPENVTVSLVGFYMDPSHLNPLPPDLLAFVPRYYGYARTRIVRLQENPALLHAEHVSLDQVFGGASPDYAVVAQKAADASVFEAFDAAFEKEYGLSTSTLLQGFDRGLAENERRFAEERRKFAGLEAAVSWQAKESERREAALQAQLERLANSMERMQERLAFADNMQAALLDAMQREREVNAKLAQVLHSRSWRMTKGFRFIARGARTLLRGGSVREAGLNKATATRLLVTATRHPLLRRIGSILLIATPGLKARLVRTVVSNAQPRRPLPVTPVPAPDGQAHLPGRARTVRAMLDSTKKSS